MPPIVLCLHGFPDTPHSFSDFATKLASLGYRVIAPWLRGYAPSTLDGPITTEQLVEDIKSLIEALSPNKNVFVALIEKLWRKWSPDYALSASQWTIIRECLAQSMPRPVMYYRSMFWPLLPAFKQLRAANNIETPLLYVHGVDDGCVNPESRRGQERFFTAEHEEVLLKGVGHFVALEAPDRLAQEAHRWFQG